MKSKSQRERKYIWIRNLTVSMIFLEEREKFASDALPFVLNLKNNFNELERVVRDRGVKSISYMIRVKFNPEIQYFGKVIKVFLSIFLNIRVT